jgi:RNA binding exosome subunit
MHATEDSEKVAQAIRNFCPDGAPIGSTMNRTKGHHGNEIVTLVLTIRNAKSVESLLQNIWSGFSQLDRTEIYSSLASRIDSSGTLFLRIDKQGSFKGRIRLEDSDPIKIEISFSTKSPKGEGFVDDIQKKLEEIHD